MRKQSVLTKKMVQMNLGIIAALFSALLLVATIVSQDASAQSANTLKVSPVRTDIEIPAGTSKTVKATVTNITSAEITVRPIKNDFISGDERGTPALILDDDKFAPTHSLKRFMGPISDVTIPAGESKTISVEIAVPEDAQAGGYFGAIRFAPSSPADGGQVNLNASVASLVLMTVPGDIVEKLDLTHFDVKQNGQSQAFFRTSENLTASFRFENKGNVQLGPFGKISVRKGDDVVYETDFNTKDPRDVVLPDSARKWDIPLEDLGDFGYYTASATLTYGQDNQTVEVTKSFWIIPLAFIIAAVVGLLLLIALIVGIWFFLRSYKRRILRSNNHRF